MWCVRARALVKPKLRAPVVRSFAKKKNDIFDELNDTPKEPKKKISKGKKSEAVSVHCLMVSIAALDIYF
jgi:hypothetical protein